MFLGEFLSTNFNKYIKLYTKKTKALTYIELITNLAGGYDFLRKLFAVIVVIFLGTYASSQILSSTKALHEILNWNTYLSVVVATVIILAYSLSGGIRASIWTDVAQAIIMLIAISVLGYFSIQNIGGFSSLYNELKIVDPDLVAIYPKNLKFGIFAFALGWFFHGMGLLGQPHVMNRYMALKDARNNSKKASWYFIIFSILFTTLLVIVSLAIRVHYSNASFDQELALLRFSKDMFSDFFLGLILAGLFSSTISTADSQVLVCSSTLIRDLFSKFVSDKHALFWNKAATFAIAIFIALIALYGSKSVFTVVVTSWSVLAVAFTPFLLLGLLKQKTAKTTALIMVLCGVTTTILWQQNGLDKHGIASFFPGLIASLTTYLVFNVLGFNKTPV